jgi:protein gp37
MADKSEIQWTDASWNCTRGCTKISPGCKHCYAETFAERFRGVYLTKPDPTHKPAEGEKQRRIPVLDEAGNQVPHPYHEGFDPRLAPEQLDLPLRWAEGRKIFVDSMSDLFMQEVPFEYIDKVFVRMLLTPRHTYQTLTKRAARMAAYFASPNLYERVLTAAEEVRRDFPNLAQVGINDPLMHRAPWVWWGVSVEDKKYGLPRIEHLRQVPAAVRFLSVEPLLEDLGTIDLAGIHWVILGGESGQKARDCELSWIRKVVAQCKAAGVPVFVKQLGARATDPENGIAGARLRIPKESAGLIKLRLKDTKGGELTEWPEDLRIREMPKARPC